MSTYAAEKNAQTHATMKDLKADADTVRQDLAALKDDAVDVGSQAAKEVVHRVQSGAESAMELAQSTGDKARACHKSVCKQVSKHPTAAVLISLGAGAVLGRLIWR